MLIIIDFNIIQELSPDVGEALCNLIDIDGRLERYNEDTLARCFVIT